MLGYGRPRRRYVESNILSSGDCFLFFFFFSPPSFKESVKIDHWMNFFFFYFLIRRIFHETRRLWTYNGGLRKYLNFFSFFFFFIFDETSMNNFWFVSVRSIMDYTGKNFFFISMIFHETMIIDIYNGSRRYLIFIFHKILRMCRK